MEIKVTVGNAAQSRMGRHTSVTPSPTLRRQRQEDYSKLKASRVYPEPSRLARAKTKGKQNNSSIYRWPMLHRNSFPSAHIVIKSPKRDF